MRNSSLQPGFFPCLHKYCVGQGVYGYEERWNEVRVKILREKYESELNNWMKLQSVPRYPTKA